MVINGRMMVKKLLKMLFFTSYVFITVVFAGHPSKLLDVKAVGPSGQLFDVKGFYLANPNKKYPLKALEMKNERGKKYIDVKVMDGGEILADVNVLDNGAPTFNGVKGVAQNGHLKIKAVMDDGKLLELQPYDQNHQVVIEAVDGATKFPVVAISDYGARYLLVAMKENLPDKNGEKAMVVKADTRPNLGF